MLLRPKLLIQRNQIYLIKMIHKKSLPLKQQFQLTIIHLKQKLMFQRARLKIKPITLISKEQKPKWKLKYKMQIQRSLKKSHIVQMQIQIMLKVKNQTNQRMISLNLSKQLLPIQVQDLNKLMKQIKNQKKVRKLTKNQHH